MKIWKPNTLNSSASNGELSKQFNVSPQTVSKWKNRDFQQDKSSRPNNISYALTIFEQLLIVSIRKSTWFTLEDVLDIILKIEVSF